MASVSSAKKKNSRRSMVLSPSEIGGSSAVDGAAGCAAAGGGAIVSGADGCTATDIGYSQVRIIVVGGEEGATPVPASLVGQATRSAMRVRSRFVRRRRPKPRGWPQHLRNARILAKPAG